MICQIKNYPIRTVTIIFIRVPVTNIKADHRLGVFFNSVLSLCNIFTNNQHQELQMQASVMEGGDGGGCSPRVLNWYKRDTSHCTAPDTVSRGHPYTFYKHQRFQLQLASIRTGLSFLSISQPMMHQF